MPFKYEIFRLYVNRNLPKHHMILSTVNSPINVCGLSGLRVILSANYLVLRIIRFLNDPVCGLFVASKNYILYVCIFKFSSFSFLPHALSIIYNKDLATISTNGYFLFQDIQQLIIKFVQNL